MTTSSNEQIQGGQTPLELYERNGFLSRLVSAHGLRYIVLVICVYGINQGAGEGLTFFAQQYWLTDSPLGTVYHNESSSATNASVLLSSEKQHIGLGLSPSRYAEIDAVTNIPWQIKALYGVASDVNPIRGYHKTPYMIMASLTGVGSFVFLWLSDIALSVPGSALLLLLANFSIASPDVMIDGSIAEKSSQIPIHAADLQSLCWMSFGIFKIVSLLLAPQLLEAFDSRALFGASVFTALAVFIPSCLGWMGEERHVPLVEDQLVHSSLCFGKLQRFLDDASAGPFIRLAFLVTLISMTMGFVSMKAGNEHHALVSAFAIFLVTPLTSLLVYKYESQVDRDLAKFSLYIFLSGAIQPSTPVLFYWMKQDEENCARNLPCFSPAFIANLSIVGYVTFVIGTWMYNRFLTKITYRKIYMTTQFALFLLNMIDLAWVNRVNVRFGLSDEAFVLGDEVISPMISRWNTMPMMILSAVLCPPNIFATFFALNMGLSNFGGTLGEYFGIGLMLVFDVDSHKYEQLPAFIVVRSLFRLLPILLVPLLLPHGSPDQPPARPWASATTAEGQAEEHEAQQLVRTYAAVPSHDMVAASEMVALTKV